MRWAPHPSWLKFRSARRLGAILTLAVAIFLQARHAFGQAAPDDHAGKVINRGTATSTDASGAAKIIEKPSGYDPSRVIFALAGVIGLILLFRWAGKRIFPATAVFSKHACVKMLSRTALAPRQQILLLQVGKRILVVGDSNSQLNCLCQIAEPDEVAQLLGELQRSAPTSISNPFAAFFSRAHRAYDDPNEGMSDAGEETNDAGTLPGGIGRALTGENRRDLPGVVALDPASQSEVGWHDPAIAETQSDISNLTDRIRNMKRQLTNGRD